MKSLATTEQRSQKKERQREVLLAFVAHYIRTAKPVGSATLQDVNFPHLSSATLRNYFSALEQEGYLAQQHASAGRVPTDLAYRLYAEESLRLIKEDNDSQDRSFSHIPHEEQRDIIIFLQKSAEHLSTLTQSAVFLSAPRFDHDVVISMRWVPLTPDQLACLILSDFGQLQTFLFFPKQPLTQQELEALDAYTRFRLGNGLKPTSASKQLMQLAHELYSEAMVRYVARYSHVMEEDIYRTGFSQLLSHPELRDPLVLTQNLGLLENRHGIRLLLRECRARQKTHYWVGSDLTLYAGQPLSCSVLATPYFIQQTAVGAIGLLGPTRMPYQEHFACLQQCAENLSDTLTRTLYRFAITYRQPSSPPLRLSNKERLLLEHREDALCPTPKDGRPDHTPMM